MVVVTSKLGRLAELHLEHLGMTADELAGDLFAEGKAAALAEHGVRWYVGDHVGDMVAARTAGVPGIGVATGPCSTDELREAGAHLRARRTSRRSRHLLDRDTGWVRAGRSIALRPSSSE